MKIFPAIDLRNGKVVRLTHGDYQDMKTYSDDPVSQAKSFRDDGATCLHVVDLDGAKDGELSNFDTISKIVLATDSFVEVGGGIRTVERIKKYIDAGVGRVILGTSAVKNPSFLDKAINIFGDYIAVGVDTKDGKVATDGWLSTSELEGVEFCIDLKNRGVKTVIYTDVSKDGALQGTNLELYQKLSLIKNLNIVASGGVTFLEEIEKLKKLNIYGCIVGKALYENKLKLKDILTIAEGEKC